MKIISNSKAAVVAFLLIITSPAVAGDEIVTLVNSEGTHTQIKVELALTPAEQQQGLMHRESLADDAGMLFVYKQAQRARFWMRNTLIPLDIIFVRVGGKIANIIENAEPLTDTPRASKGRIIAVLELRGGRASELNLKPGDMVHHTLLGNALVPAVNE